MSDQLGLALGEKLRDEAVEKVRGNAEAWCARLVDLVRAMPRGHEFTSDDLWASAAALGLVVREPRAMGAVLRMAATHGLVESMHTYRKSERSECHARPVLIWVRR